MRLPFDLTAITRELSGVIASFMNFSFGMPGIPNLHIPLWVIALIFVLAVAIYAQADKTR